MKNVLVIGLLGCFIAPNLEAKSNHFEISVRVDSTADGSENNEHLEKLSNSVNNLSLAIKKIENSINPIENDTELVKQKIKIFGEASGQPIKKNVVVKPISTVTLQEPSFINDFDELRKKHQGIFIVSCIWAGLLVTFTGLYLKSLFKPKILQKSTSNFAETQTNATQSKIISEADGQNKVLSFESFSKVPQTMEKEQIIAANKEPFFVSEIMMTAGPRKKFVSEAGADIDLGEDICGLISKKNEVMMWLLDGTSDLHCLKNPVDNREYFSSRLLAQCIAEKTSKYFKDDTTMSLDELVQQCILEVKQDWLKIIEGLPTEEKMFLKKNIANKNFPECATTLLIGRLSLSGDFVAYRSGDSKMLLFSPWGANAITTIDTSLSSKNHESNDRIFFRIVLTEQGELGILNNTPMHEMVQQKNVQRLIAFSDGIGSITEQTLKEAYSKHPENARKEIFYQFQGTADDKSICFIEVKEAK